MVQERYTERFSQKPLSLKKEVEKVIDVVEEIGPTERNNSYPSTKYAIAELLVNVIENLKNSSDRDKTINRALISAKGLRTKYKKMVKEN